MMFDCDCEYPEFNPEDVLEEHEVILRELISKAVNRKIEEALKELAELKRRLEKNTKKNTELNHQLYEINRKHETELKELEKKVKREVTQSLCAGFEPLEKVYRIDSKTHATKCTQCSGGYVMVEVLGKMSKVSCPHCSYGEIRRYEYFPKADVISSVQFFLNENGLSHIKIWLKYSEYETEPKRLYKTKELCQQACDKKNTLKQEAQE